MHEDLPNNAGYVHHYTAEILSVQEQYAFGMEMPGRSFSVEEYRYGMNGQEKSDEIFKGALTAEFWEYDSRIGRRWNMDPIFKEWESPFACFFNNPTNILDPFGLDGEGPNGECPGDISQDGTKTYGLDGTTGENRWHDNSYSVTIVENKNVSNNDWRNLTRNSLSPRVASSSMTMEIKGNYEIKVPELKRARSGKDAFHARVNATINEELGDWHGQKRATIFYFAKMNSGLIRKTIVTQLARKQGMPSGPKIRYVQDPLNPKAVIDLRHMLVVGYWGPIRGHAVEIIQSQLLQPSAGNYQDYYSNDLGYDFYAKYGSMIEQNPNRFAEYLTWFLCNPSNR